MSGKSKRITITALTLVLALLLTAACTPTPPEADLQAQIDALQAQLEEAAKNHGIQAAMLEDLHTERAAFLQAASKSR